MTDPAGALVVALFGLAAGSFLNVCIHRLPRGESVVTPRSRCPACGQPIRWVDNVPVVAYLALRGRCRRCRAPISPMYPLVEAVTPALFLLQYREVGLDPLLAPRLLFTGAMVVLFAIDARHRVLPDVITLPGIAAGMIFALFLEPGWIDALIGVIAGGGSLLAISEAYYRARGVEGLGLGDVKMVAAIGAFLGWQMMLVALITAFVLGAVVGIGLIATGRGGPRSALPFGSFLAVTSIAATVTGGPLIDWYVSLY